MTPAKVAWTDVDHVGTITIIGRQDASVIVGTATDLMIINDAAGIGATGDLSGTLTCEIAIGTSADETGVAAAARGSHS